MICWIFMLVFFGIANAQYWHYGIQDTPEVAAAKAEHFAAVEKAKLAASSSQLHEAPNRRAWSNEHYTPHMMYHGPIALPPGYNKHGAPLPVQDTPEVAAAKANHFALVARSMLSHQHHNHGYNEEDDGRNQYHSEYNSGIPYNVHHHHLAAYRSKRSADLGFEHGGFAAVNHFQQPLFFAHDFNQYHGPIALPPGYDKHGAPLPVLDTPEVAAEKAKHLALVAKERAWSYDDHTLDGDDHFGNIGYDDHDEGVISRFHGGGDDDDDGEYYGGHGGGAVGLQNDWKPTIGPYGGDFKYHGPIALPPGYDKHGAPLPVLDTPEVAAEKAHHFAAYAKVAADHQTAKNNFFYPNY